jgi:hypothetical protein
MHPIQMTKKVRVKCGVCSTINVAVEVDGEVPRRPAWPGGRG